LIGDLGASCCHEQGKDYQTLFGGVASVGQFLERLIEGAPQI
jgi:hypothetical protein